MKYKVTVNDKTYEVDIEDINARPVVARVDGVRFEVMPENGEDSDLRHDAVETLQRAEVKPIPISSPQSLLNNHALTAPLPGTITEIFVKDGDAVEMGQVLLVIEAMKMKNSIRSTHGGVVESVLVNAGQSVAHKQALVKFTE